MANYDERYRNYFAHQAANLKTAEKLRKRGVKKGTPNMPKADYTHHGNAKRLREGEKQRRTDLFIDQILRSLKGK